MNRTTMTRIGLGLGALIILALVAAGAFWAGARTSGAWIGPGSMMQPYVDPDGQIVPGPQNMPGYQGMPGAWQRGFGGMPMMGGGAWGFSPFGLFFGGLRLLLFIGVIFLVFALFRRLFFGWGPRPWHGHGPEGFEARAREHFAAWHKEAHTGEAPTTPQAQ